MPARKHKVIKVERREGKAPVSDLIIRRIEPMVNYDLSEGAELFFAVVKRAIYDFCEYYERWKSNSLSNRYDSEGDTGHMIFNSAVRYLSGDMIHAQLLGIDPVWFRESMAKLGFDVLETEANLNE